VVKTLWLVCILAFLYSKYNKALAGEAKAARYVVLPLYLSAVKAFTLVGVPGWSRSFACDATGISMLNPRERSRSIPGADRSLRSPR
jgi:hypothetical protein